MKLSLRFASVVVLAALIGWLAPCARADSITYTYTGNPFPADALYGSYVTGCADVPVTGACAIDGTFTLSAPLGDNLTGVESYTQTAVESFSFTDGFNTLTDSTPDSYSSFYFDTDANGNIIAWNIEISLNDGSLSLETQNDGYGVQDESSTSDGGGEIEFDAGSLVEQSPSQVPEPSTWVLFGTALALMSLVSYRRRVS